jgi:hypothetical protein
MRGRVACVNASVGGEQVSMIVMLPVHDENCFAFDVSHISLLCSPDLILFDIPEVAPLIARTLQIPSFVISNFGWCFISF